MFKEGFTTCLVRTVFGNPTLASYFKFLMEFFISVGTFPYSFGPIEDAVLVTYFSVHSMLQLHLD